MLFFTIKVMVLGFFSISSKRDLPRRIKRGKFKYGACALNVFRKRTRHFRDTAKIEHKIYYMYNKYNKITFIACFDNAS